MKKIITLSLALIILLGLTGCGKTKEKKETNNTNETNQTETETKKLTIYDENSNTRPYAIVINNVDVARKAQTGLQDAQVIYEVLAEGGITRFVAIFKDKQTTQIGTIRSARHNFLDYAFEYDAILVHFGGSLYAYNDIKSTKINDLDGMTDSGFYRSNPFKLASEHTAYTNIARLDAAAKQMKYKTTTSNKGPLEYTTDEVDLTKITGSIDATSISIPFSNYTKNTYTYDKTNKVYKRFVNGKSHVDMKTKKQFTFKNIIIAKMSWHYTDSKYYLDIENKGTGSGYFITNGKAIPITWEKKDRTSQTIYKDKSGNEIKLSDGNTFIELQPKDQKTSIK